MAQPQAEPPFDRIGPAEPLSPVVLSVPHAGRAYRADLLAAARLPLAVLEGLEDRFVDRLVWRAAALGPLALVARAPRLEIDLNRDEREIEAAAVAPPLPTRALVLSPRVRGGLGLVPTRLGGHGAIWSRPIARDELRRRIETVHRPYHDALAAALGAARKRFGIAVLLDCHSMPPRPAGERGGAGLIVFGDRHGTTIAPDLLEAAIGAARACDFATRCNAPYAGGHIASRHGRPGTGVHALQIEIDRSAYLAADLRSPGPGFDATCRLIAAITEALSGRALDRAAPMTAIAAE